MMCHFLEIYAFPEIAVGPSKGIGWQVVVLQYELLIAVMEIKNF